MARAPLADEIAATCTLCRALGLGDVSPILLKAARHTTLLIAPPGIVARVESAEPADTAIRTAHRELGVTRHLAGRDAPAIAPLDAQLAGPHVTRAGIVTLWPYVAPLRPADDADAMVAATTLAAIHHGLRDYRGDLPPYTAMLDRCWTVLVSGVCALAPADRELLATHYRRLRAALDARTPMVPLHGDVHLGNLLPTARGALWTDFEDACRGPPEMDIAGLPKAAWPRFAAADPMLIRQCADLKSVCVAIWCAADRSRSVEVRAAADYHLHRVRQFGR